MTTAWDSLTEMSGLLQGDAWERMQKIASLGLGVTKQINVANLQDHNFEIVPLISVVNIGVLSGNITPDEYESNIEDVELSHSIASIDLSVNVTSVDTQSLADNVINKGAIL